MKTLDVCGLSCPEPLIKLKDVLESNDDITLLTDSKNALDNCVDYAKRQGFNVNIEKKDEIYKLKISR